MQHLQEHTSSLHPQPMVQQYEEVLPRRSSFERDQWLLQLLVANPVVLGLLEVSAQVAGTCARQLLHPTHSLTAPPAPATLLGLHPTLRSIVANLIGDWNSEVVASKAHQSPHLGSTERVLSIMRTVRPLMQ